MTKFALESSYLSGTVQPDGGFAISTAAGASNPSTPTYTAPAPGTLARSKVTLAANTAATLFLANTAALGCRLLNWTASIVYLNDGTTGTPASGAPSDYIPAAASGVPGQFESPYPPTTGMRAVGASAGDITVETW
jgi:hypothetical protein